VLGVVHFIVWLTRCIRVLGLHVCVDTIPWYRSISGVLLDVVAVGHRRALSATVRPTTVHLRVVIFLFIVVFYVWTTMSGRGVGNILRWSSRTIRCPLVIGVTLTSYSPSIGRH
jgi:hypothetical protein